MASRRQALKPKSDNPARGPAKRVDKWGDQSDYVPTELEKAAVATTRRKLREAPCLPSVKAVKQPSGKSKLVYDHPHQTYAICRTVESARR